MKGIVLGTMYDWVSERMGSRVISISVLCSLKCLKKLENNRMPWLLSRSCVA